MKHVMHDLETLGQTPGCAILSIGAVRFGPDGVADNGFYKVVSRKSCRAFGLHEDLDTIAWWERQSDAARQVLAEADGPTALPLDVALFSFANWLADGDLTTINSVCLWGNGSDFDNAIMACAHRAVGIKTPWRFWNNRCFRTLKNLDKTIEVPGRKKGVAHNALDDARWQAECAVKIISNLNLGW